MAETVTDMTVDQALRSYAWQRVEGARRAHSADYLRFLWNRAIWRKSPTPEHRQDFEKSERDYTTTLHKLNQLEGGVMSMLMKRGVDVDQLPDDPDQCPRCPSGIVESYGCECTNVINAIRDMRTRERSWADDLPAVDDV